MQLQLENQQLKADIYGIIHEITDTFTSGERLPSPEWYRLLSSGAENQILQSNYDELWDSHINFPCEITAGLYGKLVQRHDSLRRLYDQTLTSHMALEDGPQHLTQLFTNPSSV